MIYRIGCIVLMLSSLSLASFEVTAGNGMRCGNKLVRVGATVSEVKLICGQPVDVFDGGFIKRGDRIISVTNYVYDLGKGKFLRILEFRNGKLHDIRTGPRL
ncbi:MAG: DUF2845 domain-containing protein [Pseudomonadota bacterium]